MRLFGSELKRLWSRRLFRWVLLLFVGALLLVGTLVFVNGNFYRSDLEGALYGLSLPLIMLGWLVGASAIGAEWTHRTVSALLTWEPRRTRVLATKALAAAVFTAALVVVLQAVLTSALLVGAQPDPAPFDWATYLRIAGRILLAGVFASVLGFALATIGRNTGAALGFGMAYLLIAETLVRAFKPAWSEWLLSSNMSRLIGGEDAYALGERSTAGAAGMLVLYSAGLFVAALWFFRRREIA